jgi:hypothetical protein
MERSSSGVNRFVRTFRHVAGPGCGGGWPWAVVDLRGAASETAGALVGQVAGLDRGLRGCEIEIVRLSAGLR